MLIKDIRRCSYFTAQDSTILCELLHPCRENVKIPYSIAHATLKPGHSSKPHRLRKSSEIYYILKGNGIMYIDDEQADVTSGQAIFIPPESWQHVKNVGTDDLKFLCIVYPMWKAEDEEVREADP